jgi:hypothetical protein
MELTFPSFFNKPSVLQKFDFSGFISQIRVVRIFDFPAFFHKHVLCACLTFPAFFPQTRVQRMFDFPPFFRKHVSSACLLSPPFFHKLTCPANDCFFRHFSTNSHVQRMFAFSAIFPQTHVSSACLLFPPFFYKLTCPAHVCFSAIFLQTRVRGMFDFPQFFPQARVVRM